MTPESYAKRIWGFKFLNDCFPRGIRGTDVDFMVEIGGQFLVIEFEGTNKAISKGQAMCLLRLSRQPNFTVVLAKGDPPDDVHFWHAIGGTQGADRDSLHAFVTAWSDVRA